MSIPTMEGINAKTIKSDRITTRVLFSGPEDGIPVLFLHGNVSSATWWEDMLVSLPEGFRGIAQTNVVSARLIPMQKSMPGAGWKISLMMP